MNMETDEVPSCLIMHDHGDIYDRIWIVFPILESLDCDCSLIYDFHRDSIGVHMYRGLVLAEFDYQCLGRCIVLGHGTKVICLADRVFLIDVLKVCIYIRAISGQYTLADRNNVASYGLEPNWDPNAGITFFPCSASCSGHSRVRLEKRLKRGPLSEKLELFSSFVTY